MYLPPIQAIQDSRICINGDVSIHPSAAIAPGVLLQANPGSQIIVGAGACIGMGAVLHAHEGVLTIQDGASLGAGVLVVGNGEIGPNACIGSSSTLINCSVPAHVLVPPGSLLGDRSRQVQLESGPEIKVSPALKAPQAIHSLAPEAEPTIPQPTPIASPTIAHSPVTDSPVADAPSTVKPQPAPPHPTPKDEEEPISTYVYPKNSFDLTPNVADEPEDAEPATPPFVHGQAYVANLLSTLLPNRANSNPSPPNP